MTPGSDTAALAKGVELLERAITYTQCGLQQVTPAALGNVTPCRGWDLRALLAHMADSLVTLSEAAEQGGVDLEAVDVPTEGGDVVAVVRQRACRLLGAWARAERSELIPVGDRMLTSSILTGTGALEIAIHGWDVAQACESDQTLPAGLAAELLELAPLLVTDADRPTRFGPPTDVSPTAGSHERLLAFLGRSTVPANRPFRQLA